MTPPPYLNTLTIVERIITGSCQLITIILFSHLLLRRALKRLWRKTTIGVHQSSVALSNSLILYMTYHAVLSLSGIPYQFLIIWTTVSSSSLDVNPYIVFWTSLIYNTYVSASPVPMFFLTLDRCLAVWLTFGYSQYSRLIYVSALLSSVFVYAGLFLSGILELPLNLEKLSKCTTYTCFSLRNHGIAHIDGKLVLEIASLCVSICFFFILKYRTHGRHTMLNRIVKLTVIAELCCNVIPSLVVWLFNTVTGLSFADYAGPYVGMLFTIETAFCSVRYTAIFLEKQKFTPVTGGSSNLPQTASNHDVTMEPIENVQGQTYDCALAARFMHVITLANYLVKPYRVGMYKILTLGLYQRSRVGQSKSDATSAHVVTVAITANSGGQTSEISA